MRLRDFRANPSIPGNEQLYFVNELRFPRDTKALPVFRENPSPLRRLVGRFSQRALLDLPDQDSLIFAGRTDHSWQDQAQLALLFGLIARRPSRRYIVLLGKSDLELGQEVMAQLPPNVSALIGNNVSLASERLHFLPMGRDFRSRAEALAARPNPSPSTLVYCNFSINTHPDRQRVYDLLRDKTDFVRFEHMGKFRQYAISREEFFHRLGDSKFAICPRGNGIDTFRVWDCLALGVVPIVVREAAFHAELSDLPVLFLDDISEFSKLTSDHLEQTYQRMLDQSWNYEKLTLSFWFRKIEDLRRRLLERN